MNGILTEEIVSSLLGVSRIMRIEAFFTGGDRAGKGEQNETEQQQQKSAPVFGAAGQVQVGGEDKAAQWKREHPADDPPSDLTASAHPIQQDEGISEVVRHAEREKKNAEWRQGKSLDIDPMSVGELKAHFAKEDGQPRNSESGEDAKKAFIPSQRRWFFPGDDGFFRIGHGLVVAVGHFDCEMSRGETEFRGEQEAFASSCGGQVVWERGEGEIVALARRPAQGLRRRPD